jgi:hypothetical protein
MAKVKFYGLSELLNVVISKCQVSEEDWDKACNMLNELKDSFVLNFEDEFESFIAIKLYRKVGFDCL